MPFIGTIHNRKNRTVHLIVAACWDPHLPRFGYWDLKLNCEILGNCWDFDLFSPTSNRSVHYGTTKTLTEPRVYVIMDSIPCRDRTQQLRSE